MINSNSVFVDVELNNEQADALERSIAELPDFHIGKIFARNCISECRKNDGKSRMIMPLALEKYLLFPRNAFEVVSGLAADLVKQIRKDDHAGIIDDDYGYTVKGFISSDEYDDICSVISEYPEFHVVRSFFETGIDVFLKKRRSFLLNNYEKGGLTDNIGISSVQFPVYCFKDIFQFVGPFMGKDMNDQIINRKCSLGVEMFR